MAADGYFMCGKSDRYLYRYQPAACKDTGSGKGSATMSNQKTISSACVVTWFNPQAIIDGTMMLGAFHVTLAAGQETPFITGVACASFFWFIGLTFLISLISSKFNAKVMRWINIVCGVIIIGYG